LYKKHDKANQAKTAVRHGHKNILAGGDNSSARRKEFLWRHIEIGYVPSVAGYWQQGSSLFWTMALATGTNMVSHAENALSVIT